MTRLSGPATLHGALVIDKPRGQTSHDVVDAARRALGFRQIGHLGTLDPLATGVLVLLVGRATRLAQFYAGRRKRYESTFRFGFATDTYDADGSPLGPDNPPHLECTQLEQMALHFTGRFLQTPPPFSAKKIRGRPAHELARKRRPVELKPVEVEVFEFRLLTLNSASARFAIECAGGTYIRSLAKDMGDQLGCGAHLTDIKRTAVGEFTLDRATPLADLERAARAGNAADHVVPVGCLLPDLASVRVSPMVERQICNGAQFRVSVSQIQPVRSDLSQGATAKLNASGRTPTRLRVFNEKQQMIAIAEAVLPQMFQPVVVLDGSAQPAQIR